MSGDTLLDEEMREEVSRLIEKFECLKGSPAGIQDQTTKFGFWNAVTDEIELFRKSGGPVDNKTVERFRTWWDFAESGAKRTGLETEPMRPRR